MHLGSQGWRWPNWSKILQNTTHSHVWMNHTSNQLDHVRSNLRICKTLAGKILANWRSIHQICQCFPPANVSTIWYTITVCSNFTINDYSNDDTMKKYIKHIVASTDKYPALFTFDNFKAQCTPSILTLLDQNIILTPPNCTHWI